MGSIAACMRTGAKLEGRAWRRAEALEVRCAPGRVRAREGAGLHWGGWICEAPAWVGWHGSHVGPGRGGSGIQGERAAGAPRLGNTTGWRGNAET